MTIACIGCAMPIWIGLLFAMPVVGTWLRKRHELKHEKETENTVGTDEGDSKTSPEAKSTV